MVIHERIKLQEQEFFAARSPEIANAPNKAARDKLIRALATAPEGSPHRDLHIVFTTTKREAEATSEFVRVVGEDGGRFVLTGRGDVNTYALFAEFFSNLARTQAGVIVPTGIATDATTAPFFAHIVEQRRLARLIDFENRAGLFPAVHSAMKFTLLTLGRDVPQANFTFYLTKAAQLAEPVRNFTLSPADIAAINPNTHTAPVFRSRADAELTARIYESYPILVSDNDELRANVPGNVWSTAFHTRIWHMAEDAEWFRDKAQLLSYGFVRKGTDWQSERERYVPLLEAKFFSIYDHRAAGYSRDADDRGYRVLPPTSLEQHQDPAFEVDSYYWVPEDEVEQRLARMGWTRRWLLGWRDITSPTNERTMLPTVCPYGATGDTFLLLLPMQDDSIRVVGLVGCLSSLPFDYFVRQKLGGIHLKLNVVKQLPVLPPNFYTEPCLNFITPKVLELTYTSHSLTPFARDLGYDGPPFTWDEGRRAHLRADLDAFYARAYGLTRDELRYILDPTDVKGADYPSETFRVLKEKEIRQFGEYRTRRLVLAAWDRMEANCEFKAMGL